ncbi:MAG: hypothetical protein WAV84_09960 [Bacteroidota bacterium]
MSHDEVTDQVNSQIIPKAYHGTNRESCDTILNDGFEKRGGTNAYLGPGVYFYDNCLDCAIWWASDKKKILEEDIRVLEAELDLGICIDCFNTDDQDQIARAKTIMQMRNDRVGKRDRISEPDVIAYLVQTNPGFDSIRALHLPEKRETLYPGSRLFRYSRIVICMLTLKNIRDVRKVYPAT